MKSNSLAERMNPEESDSHQTDASDLGIAIHVVEPLYGVQDWFQVSINSDPIRLDVLTMTSRTLHTSEDKLLS